VQDGCCVFLLICGKHEDDFLIFLVNVKKINIGGKKCGV
jgi:hypothetical protein